MLFITFCNHTRSDGKATSSSTAATPRAQSAKACQVELVAAVVHADAGTTALQEHEECADHLAKPN
eukprot:12641131-Alexandrium_andersonii.AAC.1